MVGGSVRVKRCSSMQESLHLRILGAIEDPIK